MRRNGSVGKTGLKGLKTLPFDASHMKDYVEVIHFNIKSWSAQGLVFVHITFEMCIANFYFKNGEVGINATSDNL